MNPVPDDVLLPYHWFREEISEDRMEFRRDDDRLAISAVRRGECPQPSNWCPGLGWEVRCRQRAGEATSAVSLKCVTTREIALDTVLRYMERINEAIEGEGDLAPNTMVELLAEETIIGDPDDRERTPTKRTARELRP